MPATFSGELTISNYILARLVQLNVKTIFGVPGDFNLELLDYIEDNKDILWAGNANELNAAYACDGYSRVSKGLAVLVTTFGVGELSALNGVAGMMAERLPLLHIVGTPSTKLQTSQALLHHTLGDGQFNEFQQMSSHVSARTARLREGEGAGEMIDELINVALKERRPVYLGFPTDLVHVKIPAARLNTLLPSPSSSAPPASAADIELAGRGKVFVDTVIGLYEKAVNPIVLVDVMASRFGMDGWALEFIEETGMTFFHTPMGKGTLDENHPQYGGCYIGANSFPAVRALVENSDLVFSLGALLTDVNSGGFSWAINPQALVELHSDHLKIGVDVYPSLSIRDILPALVKRLVAVPRKGGGSAKVDQALPRKRNGVVPSAEDKADEAKFGKGTITQHYLWPRVQKFLREGDVVLADSGTSSFAMFDILFPKASTVLTQVLWGSIGWSVGATLGAALAVRESKEEGGADRRTVLFCGDGALQLSVQEIGTIMRRGLTPFLFILNNDGYEIERQIHGVRAEYNNIQPYNHSLLLDFFSPPPVDGDDDLSAKRRHHRVSTRSELDTLLTDPEFQAGKVIQLVEIVMPRNDAPRTLATQVKFISKINSAPQEVSS